jgi:DNA-binding CsgD family transcriptional regulator/lambda repressor-like predicted transcriptional regulator
MSAPAPSPSLSPREIEVLKHLAQGATYGAIARRLHLSPHTVDTHLRRIRAKTGSANRTQLVLLALTLEKGPANASHAPTADHSPQPPGSPQGEVTPFSKDHGTRRNAGVEGASPPPARPLPPVRSAAPDPTAATTPSEFIRQLRLLKAWSGEPSLRQLERQTGLPRSTLAQALDARHNRLPPLERVVTIVLACGIPAGTAECWKDSWRKIRMLHCLPPDPSPPSDPGRVRRWNLPESQRRGAGGLAPPEYP